MSVEQKKNRSPVIREYANEYLLISLVAFAITVIFIRAFLHFMGYPQIGGDILHIAHALWGGLLLFIAVLLPMILNNLWATKTSALLSGIGIGLFIDEVGKLHKAASQLEKDILIALGYSIPKRLRTSRMVSKADDLRIAEDQLPRRGLYEIVADTFDESDITEDERRRRTVKTQRYRLRKRLVKPHSQA